MDLLKPAACGAVKGHGEEAGAQGLTPRDTSTSVSTLPSAHLLGLTLMPPGLGAVLMSTDT